MSETESPTMDSDDDASTTSTRGSESPMTTDNETETEEEKKDPWMPMIEEAMQKHKVEGKSSWFYGTSLDVENFLKG